MRKRLSVTLSAVCVSACALMAPASVQGMRNNTATPTQSFLGAWQQWQRNHSYEIGKAFHEAALNEDFERMTAIVSSARSQGKNIAEEVIGFYRNNAFSPTFLHECRNPELVRFAVENGMGELINRQTNTNSTPLMTARNGEVTQALIDNGADVNHTANYGRTPIFSANNAEVAQVLIDNGANVNYLDPCNETPIFEAVTREVAQVLIDHGADINHVNIFGTTPLFCAQTGEVAQVLIDNGADVNHTDNHGETPIFNSRNVEVTQLLIEHGADVNHTDHDGRTPLFGWLQEEGILQLLIANGANVNHIDNFGKTPLMTTFSPKIAQVLINNGANIDDLRANHTMSRRDIEQLFRDNAR